MNDIIQMASEEILNAVWIINSAGTYPVFLGPEDKAVEYLEENPSEQPRAVYIVKTGDIITESQFLDLAT
jgi:hypothetical protein